MKYIIREKVRDSDQYHAGSKAKKDMEFIFENQGGTIVDTEVPITDASKGHYCKKLFQQFSLLKCWNTCFKNFNSNDCIFIQYPPAGHTVFIGQLLKKFRKKNIHFVAVIHDIDSIRVQNSRFRSKANKIMTMLKDKSALCNFDFIIVHNEKMIAYLQNYYRISENKMVNLRIFDYILNPDFISPFSAESRFNQHSIAIAGNLIKSKAGYVYSLPNDVRFDLFGPYYDGDKNENVNYKGTFLPEELPFNLSSTFGLVWDGTNIDTCADGFGNYLKYNNPHKTSLYLASNLPIIIWKDAALAEFVVENKIGFAVDSLKEISFLMEKLTFSEYEEIYNNVLVIGEQIRRGVFGRSAIKDINNRVFNNEC